MGFKYLLAKKEKKMMRYSVIVREYFQYESNFLTGKVKDKWEWTMRENVFWVWRIWCVRFAVKMSHIVCLTSFNQVSPFHAAFHTHFSYWFFGLIFRPYRVKKTSTRKVKWSFQVYKASSWGQSEGGNVWMQGLGLSPLYQNCSTIGPL